MEQWRLLLIRPEGTGLCRQMPEKFWIRPNRVSWVRPQDAGATNNKKTQRYKQTMPPHNQQRRRRIRRRVAPADPSSSKNPCSCQGNNDTSSFPRNHFVYLVLHMERIGIPVKHRLWNLCTKKAIFQREV